MSASSIHVYQKSCSSPSTRAACLKTRRSKENHRGRERQGGKERRGRETSRDKKQQRHHPTPTLQREAREAAKIVTRPPRSKIQTSNHHTAYGHIVQNELKQAPWFGVCRVSVSCFKRVSWSLRGCMFCGFLCCLSPSVLLPSLAVLLSHSFELIVYIPIHLASTQTIYVLN